MLKRSICSAPKARIRKIRRTKNNKKSNIENCALHLFCSATMPLIDGVSVCARTWERTSTACVTCHNRYLFEYYRGFSGTKRSGLAKSKSTNFRFFACFQLVAWRSVLLLSALFTLTMTFWCVQILPISKIPKEPICTTIFPGTHTSKICNTEKSILAHNAETKRRKDTRTCKFPIHWAVLKWKIGISAYRKPYHARINNIVELNTHLAHAMGYCLLWYGRGQINRRIGSRKKDIVKWEILW